MDVLDWVAMLGASAWLPQIMKYGRDYFTKSKITLFTQEALEVGFTPFGPIMNLRIAFVAERKNLVISKLQIQLRHQSGAEQVFAWQGVVQSLGVLNYPEVGNLPFEKESNVLAMLAKTSDVEERFIRFHDLNFAQRQHETEQRARQRLMYMQRQGNEDIEGFLQCDEMTDFYAFIEQAFSWKVGPYTMQFDIESPESFELVGGEYSFDISAPDIEELSKNREQIRRYYRNNFIPPGDNEPKLVWAWRSPKLRPRV